MLDNKTTANIIIIIMVLTWSIISIMHGVMVAVSDNFMVIAFSLGAGLVSGPALNKAKELIGRKS